MEPFDLRSWKGFIEAGGKSTSPALIDEVVVDSRRVSSSRALFVAMEGSSVDGHAFVTATPARFALVRKEWEGQPSAGMTLLRVTDPLSAFQEIAQTYRSQFSCQLVAIAGSYGKTMVKDLLHRLLEPRQVVVASPESFNSQIGVPLSLFQLHKRCGVALIEAGFSKRGELKRLAEVMIPNSAVLTHVGQKHLEHLGGLEATAEEMGVMASFASEWLLAPQNPLLKPYLGGLPSSVYHWSEEQGELPHAHFTTQLAANEMGYKVVYPGGGSFEGSVSVGFYYFLDLLNIAVKAAWLLGAQEEEISSRLVDYSPRPVRTEIVRSPLGATVINTPYCSDPQSVEGALRQFFQMSGKGKRIFCFGGFNGSISSVAYRRVGEAIAQAPLSCLTLFGGSPFKPLEEVVRQRAPLLPITHFPTLHQALYEIVAELQSADSLMIKGPSQEPLDRLIDQLHGSVYTNRCLINLAAIAQNLAFFRCHLPPKTRIMAIVKALAYGTDNGMIVRFLKQCGVDIFGVSTVDEGVALRRAGIEWPIFCLHAAPFEARRVAQWGLEVGVSGSETVRALDCAASEKKRVVKVHLNLNSGMNRLGCSLEEALPVARAISSSTFLEFEGVMTHFACADDPEQDPFTVQQIARFSQLLDLLKKEGMLPPWRHAANSAAALRFDLPECNMVRLGLALYGLSPSAATRGILPLREALSLTSRLVAVLNCKKGETVSYGRRYQIVAESARIGVVPLGYFDGLHRNYSGKGEVIIRQRRAPMVGAICMDYLMVDLTAIPDAVVGDSVLIFGEDEYGNYLASEELAARGGAIPHELICSLGPRIPRIFINEEASSHLDR